MLLFVPRLHGETCLIWQKKSATTARKGTTPHKSLKYASRRLNAMTQSAIRLYAALCALQAHFLIGAQRHRTLVLSFETALEIKLLAWREAEHRPHRHQLQQLRTLLPLRDVSPQPSLHPAGTKPRTRSRKRKQQRK